MKKRLVIAGGGHASLPVIKMGTQWGKENISITLVSAEQYLIYSGALPQFAGGFYAWNEVAIDLKNLCDRYNVDFQQDYVTRVDNSKKTIHTASGNSYSFDVLLINVGARTGADTAGDNVYPVKPMSKLLPLVEKLKSGKVRELLIAGGGAAGTELALNLSHPSSIASASITIAEHNKRLLSSFPLRTSRKAANILKKRGVNIFLNKSSKEVKKVNYDSVIMATGNEAESISIDHSLKTGKNTRILTDDTLQAVNHPWIFAAGDTADIGHNDYQQIGVHAVKQGPLLRHNIKALFDGQPLRSYKPYPVNPLILSNGPDHALFSTKSFSTTGKSEAILKYVIDMRWLEKYTKSTPERRSFLQLLKDGIKRASQIST